MQISGQIVGDTRSGKPIVAFLMGNGPNPPHPNNADFSAEDHFDAYVVFETLCLRARRKFGEISNEFEFYRLHRNAHFNSPILIDRFEQIKNESKCHDAFDLGELGRALCRPEFQEPLSKIHHRRTRAV